MNESTWSLHFLKLIIVNTSVSWFFCYLHCMKCEEEKKKKTLILWLFSPKNMRNFDSSDNQIARARVIK